MVDLIKLDIEVSNYENTTRQICNCIKQITGRTVNSTSDITSMLVNYSEKYNLHKILDDLLYSWSTYKTFNLESLNELINNCKIDHDIIRNLINVYSYFEIPLDTFNPKSFKDFFPEELYRMDQDTFMEFISMILLYLEKLTYKQK